VTSLDATQTRFIYIIFNVHEIEIEIEIEIVA
jgi:hypothetical protein